MKLATISTFDSWSWMLMSIVFYPLKNVRHVSEGRKGGIVLCCYSEFIENWKENWNEYSHKKLSVGYVYEMM